MEQDPTRICELLVGLGDVNVVGVDDEATEPLVVHIQTRTRSRPADPLMDPVVHLDRSQVGFVTDARS